MFQVLYVQESRQGFYNPLRFQRVCSICKIGLDGSNGLKWGVVNKQAKSKATSSSCGHEFCEPCIWKYIMNETANVDKFVCPVCGVDHPDEFMCDDCLVDIDGQQSLPPPPPPPPLNTDNSIDRKVSSVV